MNYFTDILSPVFVLVTASILNDIAFDESKIIFSNEFNRLASAHQIIAVFPADIIPVFSKHA